MAACIDHKDQGNALFAAGQYEAALTAYRRGIDEVQQSADADTTDRLSVLLSNSSACCAKLAGHAEEALDYANQCVATKTTWYGLFETGHGAPPAAPAWIC